MRYLASWGYRVTNLSRLVTRESTWSWLPLSDSMMFSCVAPRYASTPRELRSRTISSGWSWFTDQQSTRHHNSKQTRICSLLLLYDITAAQLNSLGIHPPLTYHFNISVSLSLSPLPTKFFINFSRAPRTSYWCSYLWQSCLQRWPTSIRKQILYRTLSQL